MTAKVIYAVRYRDKYGMTVTDFFQRRSSADRHQGLVNHHKGDAVVYGVAGLEWIPMG